jgi:hypothetical protein
VDQRPHVKLEDTPLCGTPPLRTLSFGARRTFIDTPFTNTKGELRVRKAGTSALVEGDVNGDGIADFQIELLNFTDLSRLSAIDFRR